MIDFRVSKQPAQSESQKTLRCRALLVGKSRPWAGACLMYRRTLLAASMWGWRGLSINWLRCWTEKAKSGQIEKTANKTSIHSRIQNELTIISRHFKILLHGKKNRLGSQKKLESSKISEAYFLWLTEIPLEDRAISRPRKYFKEPRSLSLNLSFNIKMKVETPIGSLLSIATSST